MSYSRRVMRLLKPVKNRKDLIDGRVNSWTCQKVFEPGLYILVSWVDRAAAEFAQVAGIDLATANREQIEKAYKVGHVYSHRDAYAALKAALVDEPESVETWYLRHHDGDVIHAVLDVLSRLEKAGKLSVQDLEDVEVEKALEHDDEK